MASCRAPPPLTAPPSTLPAAPRRRQVSPDTSYALATAPENSPFSNVLPLPVAGALGQYSIMPFSVLPFRLIYSGQVLAVVAATPAQKPIADAFIAQMTAWHAPFDFAAAAGPAVFPALQPFLPAAPIPVLPGFASCVRVFDSEAALEAYVTSTSYDTAFEASGAASPKVWGAIVFRQGGAPGDKSVEYSIRLNATQTPSTDGAPVALLQRTATLSNIASYLQSALFTRGPPFLRQAGDAVSLQPMPGFLTLQREVDRFILASKAAAAPLPVFPSAGAANDMSHMALFLQMLYLAMPIGPADYAKLRPLLNQTAFLRGTPGWNALVSNISSTFFASEAFAPQDVDIVPFPTLSYTVNTFYGLVLTILSFILVIAYVVPNSRLIRGLVGEKESKMREGMKMMGLGSGALFGSHMLWYAVFYHLPVALIIAAIAKRSFFPLTPFGSTFFLFWLFGVSSTAFMYLMSTFFSSAKAASTFCILVFIASYFPIFSFTATTSLGAQAAASILCPCAFGLGINLIGQFEQNTIPLIGATIINNWSYNASIGLMIFDTILYCVLGLYVDAVLPASIRGYGVARPWYFCCQPSFWREKCGSGAPDAAAGAAPPRQFGGCCRRPSLASAGPLPPLQGSLATEASFIEEPDAALRALRDAKRTVELTGLRKEFATPDGIKVAVDDLSLEMFEGQIFVLLGPNGAGKTTAISMLTGLLEPSAGAAHFFGQDVLSGSQAAARKSMGVCPQHDVLWPELTVKEHLDTFAAIKGVPARDVAGEVNKIIKEVGLSEKVHVRSAALSGGMKRKLSVAIALIGGSQVVILDEPTSGMDPYSRRSTWNILQNARAGRIILLTTHFMVRVLHRPLAAAQEGKLTCLPPPPFSPPPPRTRPTCSATASPSWAAASSSAAARRSSSRSATASATCSRSCARAAWRTARRTRARCSPSCAATCPRPRWPRPWRAS